jgi:cyclomaltodextrinase / maltogenic alpha-amylase / neopullulanase
MMNVASTHDSPRLATSLYNKTMDKYKAKPSDNPDYKINKPDDLTRKEQMLLLIHQFTFIGAPQIYYGEEVGMWGADDPDCRKPMVWDDIVYEDERAAFDPKGRRPVDIVRPDTSLRMFYMRLCKMRKENPVLVYGDLYFSVADDQNLTLAYNRTLGNDEIVVVFNRSDKIQTIEVPVKTNGEYVNVLSDSNKSILSSKNKIKLNLEPLTAIVLKKN